MMFGSWGIVLLHLLPPHERSMALVGSVVTKDMEANHIYAGVPRRT